MNLFVLGLCLFAMGHAHDHHITKECKPGPRGFPGSPGVPGTPGAVGPTGASGSPAVPGTTGSTGAPGLAGPIGPTGASGAPGLTGDTGLVGPTGASGTPGLTGDTGPVGPVGPTGSDGSGGGSNFSLPFASAIELTLGSTALGDIPVGLVGADGSTLRALSIGDFEILHNIADAFLMGLDATLISVSAYFEITEPGPGAPFNVTIEIWIADPPTSVFTRHAETQINLSFFNANLGSSEAASLNNLAVSIDQGSRIIMAVYSTATFEFIGILNGAAAFNV